MNAGVIFLVLVPVVLVLSVAVWSYRLAREEARPEPFAHTGWLIAAAVILLVPYLMGASS